MRVQESLNWGRSIWSSATRRARLVDRYLLAIDGAIDLSGSAFDTLERDFIEEARAFALRAGISYDTWLDVGVSERVLSEAYRVP